MEQLDRRTIMVVDDDRDIVETLCDILELRGWNTLRAYDGDEAVSLATQPGVGWILMDVRMPKRSGLEALEAIRRVRPDVQVVLMTALASADVLAGTENLRDVALLRKPFDLASLFALLG